MYLKAECKCCKLISNDFCTLNKKMLKINYKKIQNFTFLILFIICFSFTNLHLMDELPIFMQTDIFFLDLFLNNELKNTSRHRKYYN